MQSGIKICPLGASILLSLAWEFGLCSPPYVKYMSRFCLSYKKVFLNSKTNFSSFLWKTTYMSKVLLSYSNKFWSKENNWLLKIKYILKLYKKVSDDGQTEIVCVSTLSCCTLQLLFLLLCFSSLLM